MRRGLKAPVLSSEPAAALRLGLQYSKTIESRTRNGATDFGRSHCVGGVNAPNRKFAFATIAHKAQPCDWRLKECTVLNTSKIVGFVATARPAESKRFYETTLGLVLVEEGPYALVFEANGITVRVQKLQSFVPVNCTVLGWEVSDLASTVRNLSARGVVFERYAGLAQDDIGAWRTPDGSIVAWFLDPDGNTLSLTERASQQGSQRK